MSQRAAGRWIRGAFFVVVLALAGPVRAQQPAAIASAHRLATEAGFAVLAQGGNAFDAAIAVAATLAVVEPTGSSLGGGGFWLLHRAADGHQVMLDGRERAPLASTAGMFLDENGEAIPQRSLYGGLAAAIPGTPAALAHLAERYGRLPLARSLAPAVHAAEQGFAAYPRYIRLLEARLPYLEAEAQALYLDPAGSLPRPGSLIRQPELAETLRRLGRYGRDGFYAGETGRRLLASVRAKGGIWTRKDLDDYRVVEREPVIAQYRGVRIVSAALPSSGGIVLAQMLGMLEHFELADLDLVARHQKIIEVMRRAYRDRMRYLGDPDFVTVDVERLLAPDYLAELAATIGDEASMLDDALIDPAAKGTDTTHFSVVDTEGNRVAATLSNNYYFGAGIVATGTGVTLNNHMDDFALKVGRGNIWGLQGQAPNRVQPGKRPLSSMTPTFVEQGDEVLIVGTPGGSRIPTMVLLAVLAYRHGGGTLRDWVALPRYHHQHRPDVVQFEPGALDETVSSGLELAGYLLQELERDYGNMQAVLVDTASGRVEAASDPRNQGLAEVRRVDALPEAVGQ